jgi:hypothetical protein
VLLLYTLAIVGFYLSISKLGPWYVVHAAPFLALVVGLWLSGLHERSVSWPALAAIALALSGLVWLTPPLVDYDPFAESAIRIPMPMRWRALGGLPAVASCGILAGLLFALASGLERPLGERFSSLLARVLTTIFLGYALVRALLPLAHVDRLSPIAALAADLDERRRSNEPIPLPIELPPAHPWTVHYYFARDFELRRSGDGRAAPGAARSRFVLIAPRPGSRANAASPPLPR